MPRCRPISCMMSDIFDLLVIGGGINGAGIARDAAGRGAQVLLVEKDDLAAHTSSASTKLVHGGLRYLEHYEFRLVRESLIEREILLQNAPHVIWPMRFVLPHDRGLRPRWLLRLGLFVYDYIGGRKVLPPTRTVDLRAAPHDVVLKQRLATGFEYSDCWVEDSRLVVLNAVDAQTRGADIRTRTKCVALERHADRWIATLRDKTGEKTVEARSLVNAAGPWVDAVLGRALPDAAHQNLRLVKGSHLIFPRLFEGDHAYIFQNGDNRILFAIPYESKFTLVGTTDVLFTGDPNDIAISDNEARYICDAVNEYLVQEVSPEDAVSTYSGVRPLYEDKSASNSTVTRDYTFELNSDGGAPILSIFGGKITTYRKLAEHALEKLAGIAGEPWTRDAPLPGGDFPIGDFEALVAHTAERFPWFPSDGVRRLCRAYGSRVPEILGGANTLGDLGPRLGGDLYAAELDYLVRAEFAQSHEDVLWRRSKLGLHLSAAECDAVSDWFASRQIS